MKLNNIVESTLAYHEDTRSNDRLLLLRVWEAQGFHLTQSQKNKFMEVSSAESIRRVRQKIQEQGRYPANEYVKKQRKFKAMQIQQMIPKTKPEKVEELVQKPLFHLPTSTNPRISRRIRRLR